VGEVVIPAGSELAGKTIAESGLRDLDIVVLTLVRDGHTIANPKRTREIQPGDRLLCFGKMESMKGLIPARRRRGRRNSKRPSAELMRTEG
jgi:ribosomal protein S6--L-glutamate ligase